MEKKTIALLLVILALALTTSVLAYTLLNQNPKESEETQTRAFIFEFPPNTQKIVDYTLVVNITFTIEEDKLKTVAYVNDNVYSQFKFLCLGFDSNNNTILDLADAVDIMYADNLTRSGGLLPGGPILLPMVPKYPSDFHTCVFDGARHIYNATFPLAKVNRDLIQMVYQEEDGAYACVIFHFDLEWK